MKSATLPTILLVLALSVFVSASPAVNVSGTWNAQVDVGGQHGTPTFVLTQKGQKLTGTYNGVLGEAPVTGTLQADKIVLEFQGSVGKVVYTGKVAAGNTKMEGTVDYGGQASGTFTAVKAAAKAKPKEKQSK